MLVQPFLTLGPQIPLLNKHFLLFSYRPALSKFALAQDGKRYAIFRLLLQGTQFRNRGPLRELFLASTELDRSSWICSELVVVGVSCCP